MTPSLGRLVLILGGIVIAGVVIWGVWCMITLSGILKAVLG